MNILLKARQFGGTTFTDLYFLDDCLFIANLEAGIIAHNREDAQKIFRRKVKFPYDNLPDGLRERRSLLTRSVQELAFSNGSIIYVAVSVRSGTVQRLHISEHGKICCRYPAKAEEIKAGSLNAIHPGNIVMIESTAEGSHGDFAEFYRAARNHAKEGRPLTKLDFKPHFFPWFFDRKNCLDDVEALRVHIPAEFNEYFQRLEGNGVVTTPAGAPAKLTQAQMAWYVKKYERMGEALMKREYPSTEDEAFESFIKGAFFAEEMAKVRREKRIMLVPYDPALPVNTAWDIGMSDSMAIWFHQRFGMENRLIDYYASNDYGLDHYVMALQAKGYVYGKHYLPHDMMVRELGADDAEDKTRLRTLQKLWPGQNMIVVPKLGLEDGINATRRFLATCFFDKDRCKQGIDGLDNYQRQPDERTGGFRPWPIPHHWANHPADALRYLAIGYNAPSLVATKRRRRMRSARVV